MLVSFEHICATYKIGITGIIHVGGNTGEEVAEYRKHTSNIHIFEPREEAFAKIPSDVAKYPYALGNLEGKIDLVIASNDGVSSSCLAPKEHLKIHPGVEFNSVRPVEIRKLDSFYIRGCSFLNMDVQGYELEVLKGAERTLADVSAIYTEVNVEEMYKDCALIGEMDRWLKNRNFTRVNQWIYDQYGWGDALYIKNG